MLILDFFWTQYSSTLLHFRLPFCRCLCRFPHATSRLLHISLLSAYSYIIRSHDFIFFLTPILLLFSSFFFFFQQLLYPSRPHTRNISIRFPLSSVYIFSCTRNEFQFQYQKSSSSTSTVNSQYKMRFRSVLRPRRHRRHNKTAMKTEKTNPAPSLARLRTSDFPLTWNVVFRIHGDWEVVKFGFFNALYNLRCRRRWTSR